MRVSTCCSIHFGSKYTYVREGTADKNRQSRQKSCSQHTYAANSTSWGISVQRKETPEVATLASFIVRWQSLQSLAGGGKVRKIVGDSSICHAGKSPKNNN